MFGEMKKPGGAILAGLEHLDDRYLRRSATRRRRKRGGTPKMVLIGDIVGDDEDAVARATSEVVRPPTPSAARLHRRLGRCAQEVLARPQAHRRHREAHQRSRSTRTW